MVLLARLIEVAAMSSSGHRQISCELLKLRRNGHGDGLRSTAAIRLT